NIWHIVVEVLTFVDFGSA
ncbi:hypothetical protein A2U01_0099810, partial [Trifolium medium]|nr:hypothetical protein [Trifolium medium]